MDTLPLDQFRGAFRSGGFRSVGVTAAGGVFFITARPRTGGEVGLATSRDRAPRAFRDPGKAITVLHGIGVRKVEVDTAEWSPGSEATGATRRPDTAERQRRAHEAAAHDAWFRAEVEQAVAEADGPEAEWIENEAVIEESRRLRSLWRNQTKPGA